MAAFAVVALLGLFLGLVLISQSLPESVLLNELNREANTRLAYDIFGRQARQASPQGVTLRLLQIDQAALIVLRQQQSEATLHRLIHQLQLPVVIDQVVWFRPNGSLAGQVGLSTRGELINYLNGDVPVSAGEPPAADVAVLRARTFLDTYTNLGLFWLGPPQVEHVPGQPETEVRWQQPLPELPGLTRVVLVRLRGETVWYFQHRLQPAAKDLVRPLGTEVIFSLLTPPIAALLILIAASVYLLKVSRRHAILWRVPTVSAAVAGLGLLLALISSLPSSVGSSLYLDPVADSDPSRLALMQSTQVAVWALVGYVISSLVALLLTMATTWVVCAALLHIEYNTQKPWTEVFRTVMLLRRAAHKTVLQRGLIGGGVGWFLLGVTGCMQWLLATASPVTMAAATDSYRSLFDAWSPSLLMIGKLVSNTFFTGLLLGFTWVALVDWLRCPRWLALIVAALLGSVGWRDLMTFSLPLATEWLWFFLHPAVLTLTLVVTFERFGLWATLCALWTYQTTELAVIASSLPIFGLSPWLPTLLVGVPFLATLPVWRPPESERDTQPVPLNQFLEEQRHIRQLALATQIQMSFLPTEVPRIAGWDIAATSLPAREVGGDFYDFFLGSDGKLGIFAGDVSGKSVSGALFTAVAVTAFRSEAEENELGCAAMLARLNELLYPDMKRVRLFVAAVYVQLDLATGCFTVANAGFPVIGYLRRRSQGRAEVELLDIAGLPLGSRRRTTYEECQGGQLQAAGQEFLVLASDGIVEALNERGEPYGYEAVQHVVNDYLERGADNHSAQALCAAIISDVRRHMGEAEQTDDMTVVVVRRNPSPRTPDAVTAAHSQQPTETQLVSAAPADRR